MGGSHSTEFPNPQTVAELNLHLVYLQRDVSRLVEAMPQMATKADIDSLRADLAGYATQDDLRSLKVETEQRLQKLEGDGVRSTVKAWAEWAQRLSAILAFGTAFLALALYLADKLK